MKYVALTILIFLLPFQAMGMEDRYKYTADVSMDIIFGVAKISLERKLPKKFSVVFSGGFGNDNIESNREYDIYLFSSQINQFFTNEFSGFFTGIELERVNGNGEVFGTDSKIVNNMAGVYLGSKFVNKYGFTITSNLGVKFTYVSEKFSTTQIRDYSEWQTGLLANVKLGWSF